MLYLEYRIAREQYGISLNDFIIKAVALALSEFPDVNSHICGEEQVRKAQINIGVAVEVEGGLRVPVLLKTNCLTLREISEQVRSLAEKARQGKVSGMGKATFTITNLGLFGVTTFCAIINPPEAAILAIGVIRECPVVVEGNIVIGRTMGLTLSCDHRIIDGALAARFLNKIKQLLESPKLLIDEVKDR